MEPKTPNKKAIIFVVVIVSILLLAGLGVGLYFLLRPKDSAPTSLTSPSTNYTSPTYTPSYAPSYSPSYPPFPPTSLPPSSIPPTSLPPTTYPIVPDYLTPEGIMMDMQAREAERQAEIEKRQTYRQLSRQARVDARLAELQALNLVEGYSPKEYFSV